MIDEDALLQRVAEDMADRMSRSIDNQLRTLMLLPVAKECAQREHWHMIERIIGGKVYFYRCPDVQPGDPFATCGVILNGGQAYSAPPGGAA